MSNQPPPNWDWVTARHTCSGATMLETLREQVEKDAAKWNELNRHNRFIFRQSEDRDVYKFIVIDSASKSRRAAEFDWSGDAIEIRTPDGKVNRVTLTLNDNGECKFKFGDSQLDAW